jgi:hypothetical protein
MHKGGCNKRGEDVAQRRASAGNAAPVIKLGSGSSFCRRAVCSLFSRGPFVVHTGGQSRGTLGLKTHALSTSGFLLNSCSLPSVEPQKRFANPPLVC